MNPQTLAQAAVAAHRFGLGEPRLAGLGADPAGWLLAQIGPADVQAGDGLLSGVQALHQQDQYFQQQRDARRAAPMQRAEPAPAMAGEEATRARSTEQSFADYFRAGVHADLRARLGTAASTARPFAERLAMFWANHFTVSMAKANVRGLVGAYEREAIRPHIAGRFDVLLGAAVRHAAMLRYLDNDRSAGPRSPVVRRLARQSASDSPVRIGGLNENLARELLELHTLGVDGGGGAYGGWGGYGQADVRALAAVLTGWRSPPAALRAGDLDGSASASLFDPAWHEPGPKTVLGRDYPEGPQALDQVLQDLTRHPSTARFLAYKLARHFVADQPPPSLVARLAQAFQRSEGDLTAVYRALIESPEAWAPGAAKLKSPEEWVLSSVRLLGAGQAAFSSAPDAGISGLGQRLHSAPSPAGWPDQADEWLGPDAVWKRVEWVHRVTARVGARHDARRLAEDALGPWLSSATRSQVQRAVDAPQALALLLLAPEHQRR